MKKLLWFDGRKLSPEDGTVLPLVSNSGIENILVEAKNRNAYKMKQNMHYIVQVEQQEDMDFVAEGDVVLSGSEELLEEAKRRGNKTAIYVLVNDRPGLDYAYEEGGNYDYAVIKFDCVTNIPLELLIATFQNERTILLKEVQKAQDGKIAFDVMEAGADGVLLSTTDIREILELDAYVESMEHTKLKLVPGKVKAVEHIGMGYRACIDTTSMLKKNEGMLIGSFSRGGVLLSSEMHELPYMNLRPFRVNAGAVHSYVWTPGGNTEYLTDLKSGSKVLAVDHEGNAREVSVGRIKIEARPLLKITVEAEGQLFNVIVQDDWHIRVLGMKGEPYNASILTENTELATYVCEPGRHVGIKIEEDIIEK
ncbi:3-dehydroquinate synthase II [Anaerocolumna jejuensis DSM 15929]|uniref:3-dehydroquinate synthase II n=1 Tax=Anaerocolumna jejuensis DSM 15929 TaxID=1121322 RepID=A0A1M6NWZ4_9FIRM|nr:3-dehydroquinate synthase II [Anaerocolumna jejuensis]SHK00170.1 3-dehydroquinate synthase II [Anaerocolumna jejuensis DSM 15929]